MTQATHFLVGAAALLGLAGAACGFDADYAGTRLRCPGSSPACPPGFTCVAEVCTPADETVDASARTDGPTGSVCERAAAAADNDRCAAAIDLSAAARAAGGATVYGDTTGYAGDFAPVVLPGCTGSVAPGPDAVYRLDLQAGDQLDLTLAPELHDGAVYLLAACGAAATCVGGADTFGPGAIDEVSLTISTTTTYYLVVDASIVTAAGCFTLTVRVT
ncbi:MAG: hypothetical protein KBG28_12855 [Kofleriaceae bacterium]|jgi:hypothetical protein|nr:hypothetical protein [Kofleriaceae bacterium]